MWQIPEMYDKSTDQPITCQDFISLYKLWKLVIDDKVYETGSN